MSCRRRSSSSAAIGPWVKRQVGQALRAVAPKTQVRPRSSTRRARLRIGRQHPAHSPGAGENAGRSRKPVRGEQCSDRARVGGACAVERRVGHGSVGLVLPQPRGGGAGMPKGSGHRVRVEAHRAGCRGRGAERVAGPGAVESGGVVVRPEGVRYPDRDLAAGEERGKEVGALRASSLGGGQGGGEHHRAGVDRPGVERIVERVHTAVERVHEGGGGGGDGGGASDHRGFRGAAGFGEQSAYPGGRGRGPSRAHHTHGVEDMVGHLSGDGRGRVPPLQAADEGREAPFWAHLHAAGRFRCRLLYSSARTSAPAPITTVDSASSTMAGPSMLAPAPRA